MSEQTSLDEMSVAEYLANNPDFFTQYGDLLANMYVPAQNGAGTISLVERQQQAQRDKIRQLEANYSHLLRIGNQNDAISEKLHRFTLQLFTTPTHAGCLNCVQNTMQQDFNVDHCKIILFGQAEESELHQTLSAWAQTLREPYCGSNPEQSVTELMGKDFQSYACIPLKSEASLGLLILASTQSERFYAGMGTMFLTRIGELVSLALSRA